jgi:DNA-binding XRE family transcriptional regulator/quercetin dioxygenase-like cupin family protein
MGAKATARTSRMERVSPIEAHLGAAELNQRIGDTVRELRRARGWSLDELSASSGVSRATLSQIETSKTNPTIAVLWRVAAALGVPFSTLLGQDSVGALHVQRRSVQRVVLSADGQMQSRALSPAGTSNVELYELAFAPRALRISEPHAKGTFELLAVLVGKIHLTVERELAELAAGDAAFFRADVPHRYENRGRIEARCHNVIIYKG